MATQSKNRRTLLLGALLALIAAGSLCVWVAFAAKSPFPRVRLKRPGERCRSQRLLDFLKWIRVRQPRQSKETVFAATFLWAFLQDHAWVFKNLRVRSQAFFAASLLYSGLSSSKNQCLVPG